MASPIKNRLTLALSALLLLVASSGISAASQTLDIIVFYTDEALATSQGRDPDARIASFVEYANQTFSNSEANLQLRLVHSEKIDFSTDHQVSVDALNNLRLNAKAQLLRDQYGADLVSMLTPRQAVSGGYICGIGYLPGGADGQFYGYAPSYSFSVTAIDCDHNSFAHEIGHNLGLGHSYRQNSEGGIYPWARGYGVDGNFATVMAYPHLFGYVQQLQQFSSPEQTKCNGLPCGVDRNQLDGADAVGNLNIVAPQVAAYFPTKVEDPPPPTDGGSDGTQDTGNVTETTNLIQNGSFDNLAGWQPKNSATLHQTATRVASQFGLLVSDRRSGRSGVIQETTAKLQANVTYQLSAWMAIASERAARSRGQVALIYSDATGEHSKLLSRKSIVSGQWTKLEAEFSLQATGAITRSALYFFGPNKRYGFYLDEVSLKEKPSTTSAGGGEAGTPTETNLITNPGMEQRKYGWLASGKSRLKNHKRYKHSGKFGLMSLRRANWHDGPYQNLLGKLEVGKRYRFSSWVATNAKGSQMGEMRLHYRDGSGEWWQPIIQSTLAGNNQWTQLSGEFTLATQGPISEVSLHIFGPDAGITLYIDDVEVIELP